jgi:hypothetical protein
MIDRLSERAPSIVVFTLCAAVLAWWMDAAVWLPEAAATVVGFLAILLFAACGGRGRFKDCEDSAESSEKTWLDYELAGKGTPPGYYVLAFFGIVTIALTGFRSPYAMLAWAAFALGIVWGIANRTYPTDEEADL